MGRTKAGAVLLRVMSVAAVLTAVPFSAGVSNAGPSELLLTDTAARSTAPVAAVAVPSSGRFCNTSPVTIPNVVGSQASVYPMRATSSGLSGTIQKVTLELDGLSHQFPDDIDIALTGPNGVSLVLLSDVGGSTAVSNVDLVLDSTAASALPDATPLSSGTFRPADSQPGDVFPAPGPAAPLSASVVTLGTAFGNSDPNGEWSLWIVNDSSGTSGGGSLARGFCVNVVTNAPSLSISKTHVGDFVLGQVGAQYTVVVGSSGPGFTAGTVSVVDTPPVGMTVTALGGTGWSCTVGTLTCTRSDPLAAGATYPPITVTVDIAADATSPLVNSVTVSGGGAVSATAFDTTTVGPAANLTISKATQSTFVQGGTARYTLTVDNAGISDTAGTYVVTDTLPAGLTVAAAGGDTWDCVPLSTSVSCTRSTVLAPGASAPVITIDVDISADAPASVTNTATISGGGDVKGGDNFASVTSNIGAPVTTTVPTTTTPSTPPVVVKVKAKSSKSKLFVDVNPNKGGGFYKFQVQKKRANGTWKALKTYRTRGATETRTLDLPKGTYQVVVRAKYGFAETTSTAVKLKR